MSLRALFLMAALTLTACAPAPPELKPYLTNYDAMAGWERDAHKEALAAFKRSCEIILKTDPEKPIGKGLLAVPAAEWLDVCEEAMELSPRRARQFFETRFTPFLPDRETQGLFTGYYEPLLKGSRKKIAKYRVPVYALPPDRVEGTPHLTHAQINAGGLKGRGLEILWVDDEVDLFFAHIQGSARVKLAGGGYTRLAYAGKNGHGYTAIGKVLKDRGELTEVNMFTIRQWLAEHPQQQQEVLESNESYVFFKEMEDGGSPPGAQGARLTPGRSLAVDHRFIPYGMPLFVQTMLHDETPWQRVMIAQDTGGAIKGIVRGDIFFGAGKQAEERAGRMKGKGGYVLLLPNTIAAKF